MTPRIRKSGEFCWTNMITPDPKAALEYFTAVLGWSYSEIPGMGHVALAGGMEVGAIFDLGAPMTPPGTPAHIGVMIKVADADATVARVVELGGKARPPFAVGNGIRMSVCHDPNGAAFDIWESATANGLQADDLEPGVPSWFESITTDVPRAAEFYCALFGWTTKTMPMPGGEYVTFHLDGDPRGVAGMMPVRLALHEVAPHWGVYFTVADAAAAVRMSEERGGSECVKLREIPGVGTMAGLLSPQGVMFHVMQYVR